MRVFVAALAFGIPATAAWAWGLGAFRQEFLSDASIHYVTTLLVRDYLVSAPGRNPLSYILQYYQHYPLLGFGLWPPFFYGLSGLWSVLVPAGQIGLVFFSVTMGAAGAAALVTALWPRVGAWALFAGCIILLMPAQALALQTILLDPLCGLMCFLAAVSFARFLRSRLTRDLLLFCVSLLLAVFTKGNALLLALFPPLALALSGRWDVLRRWDVWLLATLVALPVLGWYGLTYQATAKGFRYGWGWEFSSQAIPANAEFLLQNFGYAALLCSLAGLAVYLRYRDRFREDPFWACMLALLLACLLFQSVVPAALNLRYLFAGFFSIAAFATLLPAQLFRLKPRGAVGAVVALVGCFVVGSVGWRGWHVEELSHIGIGAAADAAAAATSPDAPVILVASSSIAEAGAIAHVAAADTKRPNLYVVRASKMLGKEGYFATDYAPKYETVGEVAAALDAMAIPLVVIERSPIAAQWLHNLHIQQLVRERPENWRILGTFPGEQGRSFEVYRFLPTASKAVDLTAVKKLNENAFLNRLARTS